MERFRKTAVYRENCYFELYHAMLSMARINYNILHRVQPESTTPLQAGGEGQFLIVIY